MGENHRNKQCTTCHYQMAAHDTLCPHCSDIFLESPTLNVVDQMRFDLGRRATHTRSAPPPGTIALYLAGRLAPIIAEARHPITLGRYIPGHEVPTIDLMQYHAGMQGVSRLHAMIDRTRRGYTLTDLGSTNGTWVNDLWVQAHSHVYLCSGDQIRLGRLNMFVYLPGNSDNTVI